MEEALSKNRILVTRRQIRFQQKIPTAFFFLDVWEYAEQ